MTINDYCLTNHHNTYPGKRNKQTPKPRPTTYYCLSVWVSWAVLLISAGLGWSYLFSCIRCQLVGQLENVWDRMPSDGKSHSPTGQPELLLMVVACFPKTVESRKASCSLGSEPVHSTVSKAMHNQAGPDLGGVGTQISPTLQVMQKQGGQKLEYICNQSNDL